MIPDDFQEQLIRHIRVIMDDSPDCLLVADLETRLYLYANNTVCRLAGYSREEFRHMRLVDLTGQPEQEVSDLLVRIRAAGEGGVTEEPRITASKDGSRKGWWEAHHRCIQVAGRWVIITVSRDVSRRVIAERTAERSRRIYAALSEANEAIVRSSTTQELYQWVCEAAIATGGMTTASVLMPAADSDLLEVVAFAGVGEKQMREAVISLNPDRPEGLGLNGRAFRNGEPCVTDDYLDDSRTGPWHPLIRPTSLKSAASVPIVRDGVSVGVLYLGARERKAFDREILGLLTRMTRNIAFALQTFEHEEDRRRAEARVTYLATHDPLTGLPNRSLFEELLDQALAEAERSGETVGVMFLDLDNFKEVNDSHGHEVGDALLETLAQRLKTTLRACDVLARLGGDEFVVLLQGLKAQENAARVAGKLLDAAKTPVLVSGHSCHVSASIGVSLFPIHGNNHRALMKAADTAMYKAKDQGKNGWALYEASSVPFG